MINKKYFNPDNLIAYLYQKIIKKFILFLVCYLVLLLPLLFILDYILLLNRDIKISIMIINKLLFKIKSLEKLSNLEECLYFLNIDYN